MAEVAANHVEVAPAELQAWLVTLRETANAQQMVSRLQLAVSRHYALVNGLTQMMSQLATATAALTEERSRLVGQLREHEGLAEELQRTRTRLHDVEYRLNAAEWLRTETSRRLDEARRQRDEAERLMQEAQAEASAARQSLAHLEQHTVTVLADAAEDANIAVRLGVTLIRTADHLTFRHVLRRIDDALGKGAADLEELRDRVRGSASESPTTEELAAKQPLGKSPTNIPRHGPSRRAVLVTLGYATSVAAGIAVGYEFYANLQSPVQGNHPHGPRQPAPHVVVLTTTTADLPPATAWLV
jgi:hypothetical protein